MCKETVEEFLARGGVIEQIPNGVGKESKVEYVTDRQGRPAYKDKNVGYFRKGQYKIQWKTGLTPPPKSG